MEKNDNRCYAMLAKPVGDSCNMRCEYCYYTGKSELFSDKSYVDTELKMPDETLESYISQCIDMHGEKAIIEFAWHGGEPLMAGLEYYEKVVTLQKNMGQAAGFIILFRQMDY